LDDVRETFPNVTPVPDRSLESENSNKHRRASEVADEVPIHRALRMHDNRTGTEAPCPRSPLLNVVHQEKVESVAHVETLNIGRIVSHVHLIVQQLYLDLAPANTCNIIPGVLAEGPRF